MTRTAEKWSRWGLRLGMAAVPALAVAGVASAAVLSGDEPTAKDAVVVAAGTDVAGPPLTETTLGAFAVAPSTTSAPSPPAPVSPPSTSPPTTAPSTTAVAKAAATTTAPATAPPSPSGARATTATLALINQFSGAVRLEINGTAYNLAAGQEMNGVNIVPAASGNDAIAVTWVDVPTCGVGDAMGYFAAGKSYVLTVFTGLGACTPNGIKGPDFKVTPA